MKNLKTKLKNRFDKLDEQWRALPLKEQHRYTLLLFATYALLSVIVILKVWYDAGNSNNGMTIEHIENAVIREKKSPVLSQDSISTILKHKMYER